jgi:peptidoglycan/xylan/chitin deacetylase (PgdA/CDA1 family)
MKRLLIPFLGLCITTAIYAKPLSQVRWKAKKGTVALTFDDGPNPTYTPQILDILKKYNVKATFFVMGWAAKKYPKIMQEIVANGNAVASHTWSHPMLTRISQKQLYKEIVRPKVEIKKAIGKNPVCVRPPFGMGNKRVGAFIRKHGMIMVPMGFNSFDYKRPGYRKIASQVINNAHSGQVFLLHDGPKKREQTVKALPLIIKGIRAKGLGFSAICYP